MNVTTSLFKMILDLFLLYKTVGALGEAEQPPDSQLSFSLHFTPSQEEDCSQIFTETSQAVEVTQAQGAVVRESPEDQLSAHQSIGPEVSPQVREHPERFQAVEVTQAQGAVVRESPEDQLSAHQSIGPEVPPQVRERPERFQAEHPVVRLDSADKEVGSLSKQDSTESQSILAPVIVGQLANKVVREKEGFTDVSTRTVQPPQATQGEDSQSNVPTTEGRTSTSSPGNQGARLKSVAAKSDPPEYPAGVTTASISEQGNRVGGSDSFATAAEVPSHGATRTEDSPRVSFPETSSESATGMAFHFSLPRGGEPLRPVTCTTPPPRRSTHEAALDSVERGRNDDCVTSVVPLVSETPGMASQGE